MEKYTPEQEKLFETEPFCSILNSLCSGKANAIHKDKLIQRTGIPDRPLRKAIETLRRKGIVICADTNGFYFPETEQELEKYVNKCEKTAKSTFYTLRTAKMKLKGMQKS